MDALQIVLYGTKLYAIAYKRIVQGGSTMPVLVKSDPPAPRATSDELFEALAKGDDAAAADVLGRLDGLGQSDRQLLADIMSGAPAQKKVFPYRLKLVKQGAGKPTEFMRKNARYFRIVLGVREAETKLGKREAAVAAVMQRFKISRSDVFRALKECHRRAYVNLVATPRTFAMPDGAKASLSRSP